MKQCQAVEYLRKPMREANQPIFPDRARQKPLAKIGAALRNLLIASTCLPASAWPGVYCDHPDSSFCHFFSYSDTCYSGTTMSACPTTNLLGSCTDTYSSSSYSSTTITYWYARNSITADSASYFSESCTSNGDVWSSGGTVPSSGPTANTALPSPPTSQSSYTASSGRLPEAAVQVQATGTYGNARLSVTLNVAAALGSSTQNSGVVYSCNVPASHFCQDYYVGTYSPSACGTNSAIVTQTTPCATSSTIGTCASAGFFTTYFYSGYPVDAIQSACAYQPNGVLSESSSATRGTRAAGNYNAYVIAIVPGSSGSVLYVKPQSPASWRPMQWPMAEFMSNVNQSAVNDEVILDILDGTNLLGLIGTEIYVGYGTSDQEMLAANRFRGVYKVQ